MTQKSKSCVVTLSKDATIASAAMIEELKKLDSSIKISNTKLISFLINDYKEKYFGKNKKAISIAHRDSKKQITGKLTELNDEQLLSLSKYIEKIKVENRREVNIEQ